MTFALSGQPCRKETQRRPQQKTPQRRCATVADDPNIQLMLTCDVDLEGSFGMMKPRLIRELTSTEAGLA